jgi:hypothetical protein
MFSFAGVARTSRFRSHVNGVKTVVAGFGETRRLRYGDDFDNDYLY